MKKYSIKMSIMALSVCIVSIIVIACSKAPESVPESPPPQQLQNEPVTEPTSVTPPPPEVIEVFVEVDWISPMLSVSASSTEASVLSGDQIIILDTNDFGRQYRGMAVTEIPEEDEPVVAAQLTAADLEARGAVKMTANFAYEGEKDFPVRFRVRVDMFQGHNITSYGLGAMTGVIILWEDENGIWWNIRRTGWGGEFTGGMDTPGWFSDNGEHYPVFIFDINKDTAMNYATQDFYIIFTEGAPLRTNDVGVITDETAGYVITYMAELPDDDGHFHNFKILASASTYIHIPAEPHVHSDDHDDDDDHDHDHGHSH